MWPPWGLTQTSFGSPCFMRRYRSAIGCWLSRSPLTRSIGADARSSMPRARRDRKSTRLNSSHSQISYAVFCLKKKKKQLEVYRQFFVGFPTPTSDANQQPNPESRLPSDCLPARSLYPPLAKSIRHFAALPSHL